MQQIIPSYKSIGELLSGNKFTIDEYQREYKWEKENISDLINDLLNKFRSLYKSEHSIREVSNYEDYFLGSIILNKKNLENRDVYSIVDGQQRITSITLLLIYLYHVATTKNLGEAIRAKIQGMIYSDSWGNNSYNLDISDRYLVLDSLFKGKDFNFEIHNESVRNMYERYQDIDSENLEKELDTAFEHFLYWVCNRVKVIEISCQSSNQAYDIFETMNNRGKPLSPVDMLKSFFLSHVISDNNKLTHLNTVWRSEIYKINTWNDIYYGDREIRFFKIWFRAKYATNHDEITGR